MSKIVIIGDTHFGVRNDSEYFTDYQCRWFKWFFDYCEKNSITTIIQEGDLHDRRKFTNFSTISRVSWIFKELEKYQTIVISGNHDCYYRSTNEVNSVDILLSPYNIKVISKTPETIQISGESFDFFPWISPDNYEDSLKFIKSSKSQYAVGHFEFSQFPMHPGQIADSGMEHGIFKKYKRVYSGHYHTISAKDNVLYTGTPYELDWSDWNDPKGFWIHDKKNPEMVKTPFNIYEKVFFDLKEPDLDLETLSGKIVKVFAVNKKDQFEFDRFVDKITYVNPHELKIIDSTLYKNENESGIDESLETLSTIEVISKTLDDIDTILDRTTLKKYMNELYSEAVQISK